MIQKPVRLWARKTKVALVLGIAATIFSAVWWFYVWPGTLMALPIGAFVFLFVALFKPTGMGCGVLSGIVIFMLLIPFTESFGLSGVMWPTIIASVVVAASVTLFKRSRKMSD